MYLSTKDLVGVYADDAEFIAHALWSATPGGPDYTVGDETPARAFPSFAEMIADATLCPVCGADCGDAPVCVDCLRDAATLDGERCDLCGSEGADPFAGLCVPCAVDYYEEQDAVRRRALEMERSWK